MFAIFPSSLTSSLFSSTRVRVLSAASCLALLAATGACKGSETEATPSPTWRTASPRSVETGVSSSPERSGPSRKPLPPTIPSRSAMD